MIKNIRRNFFQRAGAVLLSAVLIAGMVSNASPASVLAKEPGETKEGVSVNLPETVEGDAEPVEGANSDAQKNPEITEGEGETVTEDAYDGTGQETQVSGGEEVTEPEIISTNDIETEPVAALQSVMMLEEVKEITGITVNYDLTNARAAQVGDELGSPSLHSDIVLDPDVGKGVGAHWKKKEENTFTECQSTDVWEEGIVYVLEIRVINPYGGYTFADDLAITSSTNETWTVAERSEDNRIVCLHSGEIVKTAHIHEYGGWSNNSTQHWKLCSCGAEKDRADHEYGDLIKDQYEGEIFYYRVCSICERRNMEDHTHEYGDWQHDSAQHWKACACGEETGRVNHDFGDWILDQEATTTQPGIKHRDCQTCKYSEEGTVPAVAATVRPAQPRQQPRPLPAAPTQDSPG